MDLKKLIGTSAYWTVNKTLAKHLGFKATILLQHLIDIEDAYFTDMSDFYQQVSRLKEDLYMNEYEIRAAKKILVEAELIIITKKGIPAKDHFQLLKDNIFRLFTSTGLKSEPVQVKILNDKDKESRETNNLSKLKKDKEEDSIEDQTDGRGDKILRIFNFWNNNFKDDDKFRDKNKLLEAFGQDKTINLNYILERLKSDSDRLEDWLEENENEFFWLK
jgi:hypothetical protein